MSKDKVLDVLAKKNDDWMNMARSFGLSNDEASEIVQGMYLKMYDYIDDVERIMYNEKEVNTFFIYKTMQNLFLSGFHLSGNLGKFRSSKIVYASDLLDSDRDKPHNYNSHGSDEVEMDEELHGVLKKVKELELENICDPYKEQQQIDSMHLFESLFGSIQEDIDCFIDSWYWYDSKMFKLYYYKEMSMRKIAKETGISLKSVWITINSCKRRIIEEFGEDYIKYLKSKEL